MRKKFVFVVLFLGSFGSVLAQDPQFSQYYAAPLYHNPAFTGSGYAPRIIFNYRNQWPSLDANFTSSAISIDNYFDKINSGIGLMVLSDQQGATRLTNTEISGFYSYQMNLVDAHYLRFGLQGTYGVRKFDLSGLTFPNQFTNTGFDSSIPPDPIVSQYDGRQFSSIDFSTGVLYYNPKAFLGISVKHLANISNNQPTAISPNIMINGGLNIPLNSPFTGAANADRELVMTPTFLLKKQGKFSQLDLGTYVTYSPFTLGLWYRGIPFLNNGTVSPNHDALVALVGFRFESFSFGYSYDMTISSLGFSSGGAHEISLAYQFKPYKSERNPYLKRKKKALACPKF